MSRPIPQANEKPAITYPQPIWSGDVVDELLVENVETNQPGYVKYREGDAHPNTREFPNHKLIREEWTGTWGLNRRYWANGIRNEDQYNYDINYSGESTAHPIFSRRYIVRRDQYTAFAKGATFSGIYLIAVTDPGSGYDPENPPTVTISGAGGAAAKALVSNDGTISWVYLTNEGSGYTSAPTVSFSSGSATAVAKLQIATGVVYAISVTSGGAGYVTAPTVTIGGDGSGATGVAQISGGAVVAVQLTAYGSGYTTATVTFGSGAATATATIQSVTPQLVKEDVLQFPEGDQRRSLYVIVQRQYESLPGPILIDHVWEPFINQYVSIKKSIVPKSMVPADPFYTVNAEGETTEYQAITEWRYAKIVSKINPAIAWENGGQDEIARGQVTYSFPNEIPVTELEWLIVYATDGDKLALDLTLPFNVTEGYSGPCEARITTRYTFDPDDAAFVAALPTILLINPQAHSIWVSFYYAGGNLIAQNYGVQIPSSLHPEITLTYPNIPSSGNFSLEQTIPATVPTTIPLDTWIVVSVKPQRWRFGLWIITITELMRPI